MASRVLRLDNKGKEVIDNAIVELETPYLIDGKIVDGSISFTVKDDHVDERYCFTLTEKGMDELVRFYLEHKDKNVKPIEGISYAKLMKEQEK